MRKGPPVISLLIGAAIGIATTIGLYAIPTAVLVYREAKKGRRQ